jgi:hypothetical protein
MIVFGKIILIWCLCTILISCLSGQDLESYVAAIKKDGLEVIDLLFIALMLPVFILECFIFAIWEKYVTPILNFTIWKP